MKPPHLHRVERNPVREERLPTAVFTQSNQLLCIAPLFRRKPRHLDIETPVFIVAHHDQSLESALNFPQLFQHIAANDNLPMLPFTQRL